jgi:hypothetical protein
MRVFHCDHCSNPVFFENVLCGRCGHKLAYLPDLKVVASLDPVMADGGPPSAPVPPPPAPPGTPNLPPEPGAGSATSPALHEDGLWISPIERANGRRYRLCRNYVREGVCNWAVPADDPHRFCSSCRLTRVIPDLSIPGNLHAWARLETAKRRVVYQIMEFGLPLVNREDDPVSGLAFEFMGDPPTGPRVLTGHDGGVITLNVIEADDVERERLRVSMHEPYRTLVGHFRHELGHYYWDRLVKPDTARLTAFRALFGDEQGDYNAALQAHYASGPSPTWREHFVSAYASVHPWEDWAETWAHYFHMTDTLETAAACGMSLHPDRPDEPSMEKQPRQPVQEQSFDEIISNWFPLTYVLNALNRGMGLADAYPFVLPRPTIEKLRFIHETICMGGKPVEAEDSEPVAEKKIPQAV